MCPRYILCDVALFASGSKYDHVYEATAWPPFRNASSQVAIPSQSSTKCIGLWGSRNTGVFAREGVLWRC
jgi:hypothetical protein